MSRGPHRKVLERDPQADAASWLDVAQPVTSEHTRCSSPIVES
jgi:hypothetical protein